MHDEYNNILMLCNVEEDHKISHRIALWLMDVVIKLNLK